MSEARVAPRSPPYPNADAVIKMVVDAKVSICKELGATHVVNSYCTSLLGNDFLRPPNVTCLPPFSELEQAAFAVR